MPAAGVVIIVAVLLIVLALVYYLVSTILALRQITSGLDNAIAGVVEIIEKSAPVNDIVLDINKNLDAGVDLLEGLLVKKAGLVDAVGLVDGLYPGAAEAGLRNFPESTRDQGAADLRGLHAGNADARPAGTRGPDRGHQPAGPGVAQRDGRKPRRAVPLSRGPAVAAEEPAAVARHRHRRAGSVRTAEEPPHYRQGHERAEGEAVADPGTVRV